jgi:hypothetical protein
MDSSQWCRYDLVCDEKYDFSSVEPTVDLNGLINGKVNVILFISYDNKNNVRRFSLYYTDQDKLCVYRIVEDSSIIAYSMKFPELLLR